MTCTCNHIALAHRYLCATRANTGHCMASGCECGAFDTDMEDS